MQWISLGLVRLAGPGGLPLAASAIEITDLRAGSVIADYTVVVNEVVDEGWSEPCLQLPQPAPRSRSIGAGRKTLADDFLEVSATLFPIQSPPRRPFCPK